MFKMTALCNSPGNFTLALQGNVSADVVPEIDRLIRNGKETQQQVVLDLSEVTLMDPAAARFFAAQFRHGIEIADCPSYLKHWIFRESINEREH